MLQSADIFNLNLLLNFRQELLQMANLLKFCLNTTKSRKYHSEENTEKMADPKPVLRFFLQDSSHGS